MTFEDSQSAGGDGLIEFISPTVDAATGLTEVHLLFDNSSGKLRSGILGKLLVPYTLSGTP